MMISFVKNKKMGQRNLEVEVNLEKKKMIKLSEVLPEQVL